MIREEVPTSLRNLSSLLSYSGTIDVFIRDVTGKNEMSRSL
jgi:hypothetical protein